MDDLAGVEAVQALALSQVPKHGNAVLSEVRGERYISSGTYTGGTKGRVGAIHTPLHAGLDFLDISFKLSDSVSHLASGGAEGAVGGDGDGVDVTGVAQEVVLELAVPDLKAHGLSHRGLDRDRSYIVTLKDS